MGSNMAENHPVAFRFVTQAQQRGATVIHVDPRFTRTSALANIHAPIRSGTDIAFLGGIIRYILFEDKWFTEFALAYTNIATIIEDGLRRRRGRRRRILWLSADERKLRAGQLAVQRRDVAAGNCGALRACRGRERRARRQS